MDKTLPNNREAEEATLAAVLIAPDLFPVLSGIVGPEDFYIHRHRWIWEAFGRMDKEQKPIDFLTVTDELDRSKLLAEVGGPAYLTALVNQCPTILNAETYAGMVHALGVRRNLIAAANQIASLAYDDTLPVEDVISKGLGGFQVAANGLTARKARDASTVVSNYADMVLENSNSDLSKFGIPSGFPDVDRGLGYGFYNSLFILAGRPGSGKTSFALQVANNAAKQKRWVYFISLEMQEEQLMNVMIAQETEIDSIRLKSGRLVDSEWSVFDDAVGKMENATLMIDDSPRQTIPTIRAKCLSLQSQGKLDFLIVDYLLLLGGYETRIKEHERVNGLARDMKLLQHELNIPVLCMHQQNRGAAQRSDKRPSQEDLREGGEMDADIVAFLWEPPDAITQKFLLRKLTAVKHRGGSLFEVELIFKAWCTKFESADKLHKDFTR